MIFRGKNKKNKQEIPRGNTLRSPMPETPPSESQKKRKKKNRKIKFPLVSWLQSMLDGSMLTRESFTRSLPFWFFLGLLGLVYIGNSYYAIRLIRRIDALNHDMKEYHYEYVTSRSALMYRGKPSELARHLDDKGIKESLKPPEKIFIEK